MPARVLVVDDTPLNVKLLVAKLSSEYYQVYSAADGPSALEQTRLVHPDIILLDVMMPGMDGFEVCRRLKADAKTAHIPVVMVTALSDPADRLNGLDSGADDFLTKPVDDVAMFARVRSLVRLKTMVDELRMRQETEVELGAAGPSEDLSPENPRPRILLVEDSPLDLSTLKTALKTVADLVEAGDGASALAAAANETTPIDLMVVSLTLEGQDGLRVASALHAAENTRRVPVLVLVDDGDRATAARALELGATDYLVKPIDPNEILARARTQIRRKRYQDRLLASYRRTVAMATTDELTGLFNRRYFLSHLENTLRRAEASGRPVAVMLLDIDHFKNVNDTHGHLAGDRALTEIGHRIGLSVRGVDMAARYGGEEFVVMMPETDVNGAKIVAERIRAAIGGEPFDLGAAKIGLTISIGIAGSEQVGLASDRLIARADDALYRAKREGRDRVIVHGA